MDLKHSRVKSFIDRIMKKLFLGLFLLATVFIMLPSVLYAAVWLLPAMTCAAVSSCCYKRMKTRKMRG